LRPKPKSRSARPPSSAESGVRPGAEEGEANRGGRPRHDRERREDTAWLCRLRARLHAPTRPAISGLTGTSTAPATWTTGRPIAPKRSRRPSPGRAASSTLRGGCRAIAAPIRVPHSRPFVPHSHPIAAVASGTGCVTHSGPGVLMADRTLAITSLLAILLSPCLLYTSPSPRDLSTSRMPSSA